MDSAIVMVNPWHKYKDASKRKKQALHSLIVGFVYFCVLFLFTKFVSVPLCPIKNVFHVSCPGCGLTSGFIAILKLDFVAAFYHNVLSIPIFIGIIIYAILCITDIIFDKNNLEKIETFCLKKTVIAFLIIVFIASIIINNLI